MTSTPNTFGSIVAYWNSTLGIIFWQKTVTIVFYSQFEWEIKAMLDDGSCVDSKLAHLSIYLLEFIHVNTILLENHQSTAVLFLLWLWVRMGFFPLSWWSYIIFTVFFSYLVSKYRKQRKKFFEKNYVFVAIPCRAGHRMIQDKYGISSTESRHKILQYNYIDSSLTHVV